MGMWSFFKKNVLWVVLVLSATIVGFSLYIYLGLPEVTDLKTKNPETTALMRQRYRAAQDAGKEFVFRQQWVAFEKIPDLLKKTVRVTEDAGFYQHRGIDLTELKIALKKNWEKGRYVRGASTITQQLAKNLYLSTDKSIIRKIKEYFIARSLETHLTKNRIFGLYLNVIEFGPGLFGVQAASRYYFNKDVSRLDHEEIIRLTAVIPRPLNENPTRNSRWLIWKAGWILDTLRRYNYIPKEDYQALKSRFQR
jgi:monofunctional biosynthetic peptidoglycan transglycosylase